MSGPRAVPPGSWSAPALGPGAIVIAYLKDPRERFWGVVRSLDVSGIVLHGIELDSFDDWLHQVAEGGEGLSLSTVFFPLPRVEKVLVDAAGGAVPSLSERFESRTGRTVLEFLGM
jgi:hypothetical protein